MKVKIFANTNLKELQREINIFIKDKKIIDIKYQTATLTISRICSEALIMYEEE